MNLNADMTTQFANIKLLLLDVDGVLTDGTMWFAPDGTCFKPFHAHDGMGLTQLQRKTNIQVGVISGHPSETVRYRLEQLNIPHIHLGCSDKLPVYEALLDSLAIADHEVAYMGDDINDLEVLARVAVKIAVNNAMPEVKAIANYVTSRTGGHGAVREVCDRLIASHRGHGAVREVCDHLIASHT